jgi:hypothetical protein
MANDIHRCLLLLRARDGATRSAIERALEQTVRSRTAAHGDRVSARAALEIENDPLGKGFSVATFDGALDLRTEDGEAALLAAIDRLGDEMTDTFDPSQSTAAAGIDHIIDPGEGALGFFFCMKPKPGMTVAQFHDYWLNVHAPHHAHRSGLGYRQLHASPELSATASAKFGVADLGYRGIADVVLETVPGLSREPSRGDRVNFVDEDGEVGMVVARLA